MEAFRGWIVVDALGGATLVAVGVAVAIVIGLAVAVAIHPEPLPGEVSFIRRWQRLAEPIPTLAEWVRVTTSTQATLVVIAVPAWWAIAATAAPVRSRWRSCS